MDWENAPDKELAELMGKLSHIRKESRFSFAGTAVYSSEDKKLLCIKRHGEKADIALYINQAEGPGCDRDIRVEEGKFKLFVNGGEVI